MLDELPKKETRGSTATEYHAFYNEIAEFYMHLLELQLARDRRNKEGPALIPGPMLSAWKNIDNRLTSAFESTVEISAFDRLQVVNVNDAELDVYRNDTGNKQIMADDSH
ncbi:hypothetical protein K4K49_007230 [Colletotrichum sp. SAR 10_70]|nr:hypothetical protein K4K50_007643 [Colletotrichum sp. SAR 10_71]KAI8160632.1 hypothetical protein K4K49_007230 [Colletotrichum sp. SAR 10_70]